MTSPKPEPKPEPKPVEPVEAANQQQGQASWPMRLLRPSLLILAVLLLAVALRPLFSWPPSLPSEQSVWAVADTLTLVVAALLALFVLGRLLLPSPPTMPPELSAQLDEIKAAIAALTPPQAPKKPGPDEPEVDGKRIPGPTTPAPPPSPPSSPAIPWTHTAFRATEGELARLAESFRQRVDQRRRLRGPVDGAAEGQQVARIATQLLQRLQADPDNQTTVKNLQAMAERFQAAAAGAFETAPTVEPPPRLIEPESWAGSEVEYLAHLAAAVERMQTRLAALEEAFQGPGNIEWQGGARALLGNVAPRRASASLSERPAFEAIHRQLLDLLGWDEIVVNTGDRLNREIHQVESLKASREHPPNVVLEVVKHGYRDRRTGAVVQPVTVVLSEQFLG